ncbi:unnamed protein product [Paramecium sonneborni]|uniref:Uncharacterized protein n=1 Tax=Paramecium sonneborni TaxID=65129 RepID=A0A8S1PXN4_9CILI|nr:unnamed protein product [Paramecium sonneborni]
MLLKYGILFIEDQKKSLHLIDILWQSFVYNLVRRVIVLYRLVLIIQLDVENRQMKQNGRVLIHINSILIAQTVQSYINYFWNLYLNQLENILVSCGGDQQIIIWTKDNEQKWQFQYVVTQSVQEIVARLQFIKDDQLIWVTANQVSKDCISIFEIKNGKYQENSDKEVKLIQNDKVCDLRLFPIFYNKEKNLMIIKHRQQVQQKQKMNQILFLEHQLMMEDIQQLGIRWEKTMIHMKY